MKRAGFTMIELIFVIVILGILAAVALPKFVGVASQAQAGKVSAYVGTLNRTVGPALWALSLANKDNGSLAAGGLVDYDAEILRQIVTPEDVGDTAALDLTDPTVSTCSAYAVAAAANGQYTDAELTAWAVASTVTIDAVPYSVRCMDGSGTESPRFVLSKTDPTAGEVIVTK